MGNERRSSRGNMSFPNRKEEERMRNRGKRSSSIRKEGHGVPQDGLGTPPEPVECHGRSGKVME
jgi:hypothetical protein